MPIESNEFRDSGNLDLFDQIAEMEFDRLSLERLSVRKNLNAYQPVIEEVMSKRYHPNIYVRAEVWTVKSIESQTDYDVALFPELLYFTGRRTDDDDFFDALGGVRDNMYYNDYRKHVKTIKQNIMDREGILDAHNIPQELIEDVKNEFRKIYKETSEKGFLSMYVKKQDPENIHWLVNDNTNHTIEINDGLINLAFPGYIGHVIHLPARMITSLDNKVFFGELIKYLKSVDLTLGVPKHFSNRNATYMERFRSYLRHRFR